MIDIIFNRQIEKLKFYEYASDVGRCKNLVDASHYSEAFLSMWILVEVISKHIQATQRAALATAEIDNSLIPESVFPHDYTSPSIWSAHILSPTDCELST